MAAALIIFLFLVILHFVYEGIVLPSIRLKLRFSLFELRDRLRTLMCEKPDKLETDAFRYLQESINISIAFLYRINVRALMEMPRILEDDANLRKRVEKRNATLKSCSIEEFQAIRKRSLIFFILAFMANSAGFFILMIPFALFMALCGRIKIKYYEVKERIISIVCVPENELDKINRLAGFSSS